LLNGTKRAGQGECYGQGATRWWRRWFGKIKIKKRGIEREGYKRRDVLRRVGKPKERHVNGLTGTEGEKKTLLAKKKVLYGRYREGCRMVGGKP